jgi:hypothetical protein
MLPKRFKPRRTLKSERHEGLCARLALTDDPLSARALHQETAVLKFDWTHSER